MILEDLVFDQNSMPRGRMCFEGVNMDGGEVYMEFTHPSFSRRSTRVYGMIVRVDPPYAGQCACGCEAFKYIKNSRDDMQRHATTREWIKQWSRPDILRVDEGLCPHLRAVKRWILHHKETLKFIMEETN